MNVRLLFLLAVMVTAAALPASADEAANRWITKARSFLGSEQALNSVKSLHFEGSFAGTEQVPDPTDAKKTIEQPVRVGIDIIFQSPMQQRQTLKSEKIERVSALDGYDGWERVAQVSGNNAARLTLLDVGSIKRLRATTIENLSFYSPSQSTGRTIQFLGDVAVDGIDCAKLSFTHTDSIVFIRFFDKATGRLVKTEIEGGGEIREEGEMVVNGIRFPRKIMNKSVSGRVTSITFDKVTVNASFPPETFAVPSFQAK